jgi:hypothetical protein
MQNPKYPFGAVTNRTIISKLPITKSLWQFLNGGRVVEMPRNSYLCHKCCLLAGVKGELRSFWSESGLHRVYFDFGNLVNHQDLTPLSLVDLLKANGEQKGWEDLPCFFHQASTRFPKNINELVLNDKTAIMVKTARKEKGRIKELEALARKGDLIAFEEWKELKRTHN